MSFRDGTVSIKQALEIVAAHCKVPVPSIEAWNTLVKICSLPTGPVTIATTWRRNNDLVDPQGWTQAIRPTAEQIERAEIRLAPNPQRYNGPSVLKSPAAWHSFNDHAKGALWTNVCIVESSLRTALAKSYPPHAIKQQRVRHGPPKIHDRWTECLCQFARDGLSVPQSFGSNKTGGFIAKVWPKGDVPTRWPEKLRIVFKDVGYKDNISEGKPVELPAVLADRKQPKPILSQDDRIWALIFVRVKKGKTMPHPNHLEVFLQELARDAKRLSLAFDAAHSRPFIKNALTKAHQLDQANTHA